MISRRDLLLAVAGVLSLAGCAKIPRSGPVARVSQSPQPTSNPGVQTSVQPPARGASIDDIVQGFMLAMSSYQADYQVARQFLTKQAAKDWHPEVGVSIYEDGHRPVVDADGTAALAAPLVGTLDQVGRFTPSQSSVNHDFHAVRQDGEWRIANAPKGLLMSEYSFGRGYEPLPVYFLNAEGSTLVPELVHLPGSTWSPTGAITALLAGPSPWSRPAVLSALPPDTKSTVASVAIDRDGIAEVSLTAPISALNNPARERVAAQVVWTLAPFEVTGVRITVNGAPWQMPRADAEQVVRAADFTSFLPVDERPPGPILAVQHHKVGRITETGSVQFVPIAGPFGQGSWGAEPGQLDAAASLNTIAVVSKDRKQLWVATGSDVPAVRASGANFTRPQVLNDGTVWVVGQLGSAADKSVRLIRVSPNGAVTSMRLKGLPSGAVSAFRLSPDRTRMAVILTSGQKSQLGMMRLAGTDTIVVDGWAPMPAGGSSNRLADPVDLGWVSATTMVVLSATKTDSRTSAYWVSADGATVDSIGSDLLDSEPIRVAASPRLLGTSAVILAKNGVLWRFEDRSRWTSVLGDLTAVAQPG